MDTSTSITSNQNASQSSAQRKFYQWVLKWISGMHTPVDSNGEELRDFRHPAKLDVPTLASFLQAIGFKLLSFEKHNDPLVPKKSEKSELGVVRVAIECDASDMRAVLQLGGISCQCPNPEHIKDASFWSISGTGPTGSTDNIGQKVEETGSNLLPRLSKDVSRVLRDVSYKLFETITCEPDVNRNIDTNVNEISHVSNASCDPRESRDSLKKETAVTRSYTQPEICLRTSSVNSQSIPEKQNKKTESVPFINHPASPVEVVKPTLQRQKTWDIETASLDGEPRPSPPKLTSSPAAIAELSQSLGQISLQSEIEHPKNVVEYIIAARQKLEKALQMLLVKNPKTLIDLSPNQDIDAASVKSAPPIISPTAIINFCKPTRSSTVTNIKPLTNLTHLVPEQQAQAKTISGISSQTLKVRRSIGPMLSKSATRNNNVKVEQENSKPTVRRSSFYISSSANSGNSLLKTSDAGQRFLGRKFSMSKPNLTVDSDFSNRDITVLKKTPEQQTTASAKSETLNATNRRTSLIKPPTKISKTIAAKIKPMQYTSVPKVNTGMVKRAKS